MSLKGITKGFARVPQQFKSKFNMGEITKDEVFIDTERRFDELERQTKKLHDESRRYFDAINGMMTHQIEFSRAIKEIYKPISGRASDPTSFKSEGNEEGIVACNEYEAIVQELHASLKPELDLISARVVAPAQELLKVINSVKRLITKRAHKQLDYDRHRNALAKQQAKVDRDYKQEKALYKAEADSEASTQDFEHYNELLKVELPQLFALEREFIQPLFQAFYYMQLNVFYTLHERMQKMDIGYFNLQLGIEDAFEMKRGDIKEEVESLAIVKFRSTGGREIAKKLEAQKQAYARLSAPPGRAAITAGPKTAYSYGEDDDEAEGSSTALARRHSNESLGPAPPTYTQSVELAGGRNRASSIGRQIYSPPPIKEKPSMLKGASTATALYDYEAQAEGDLSFVEGDVIEIVQRGATDNEWWIGKLNGRQGQFPGNYVQVD